MNDETLKYLQEERKREFKFENIDKLKLAYELMENIGNKDSYIRDNIVYPSLGNLLQGKHFDSKVLIELTKKLISDDFLMFDMDNLIEYSSLKRTFTLLQLTVLIYVHNRDKIFSEHLVNEVFSRVLNNYINEKDLRGYVKEVGWIHSVAHAADVFSQAVLCEEISIDDYQKMMEAIRDKFSIDSYSYVSDEDERTVTAIFRLLERNILTKEYILNWVNKLGEYERPKTYPEVYRINANVKNLLRSLYFRVIDIEKYAYLSDEIKQVLKNKVKLR